MNEKLNNGIEIPCIGIGTFMLQPKDAESSVREAIKKFRSMVSRVRGEINEKTDCR